MFFKTSRDDRDDSLWNSFDILYYVWMVGENVFLYLVLGSFGTNCSCIWSLVFWDNACLFEERLIDLAYYFPRKILVWTYLCNLHSLLRYISVIKYYL